MFGISMRAAMGIRRAVLLAVLAVCGGCSASYTVGGAVSGLSGAGLVLQNNGGNDLSINANGPFTFTTRAVEHAPYDVTVLTQPSGQTCTVTNGTGRVPAANVTDISVNCTNALRAFYTFVANFSDGSVSSYAADLSSGRLKYLGKAAAGTNPQSVTVDPSGRHVYVANNAGNSVSQYTIGANGALTPMTSPTVATGQFPFSVTVDPSGRYAYVANGGGNSVSQYTIGADGSLAPMTTATVAAGSGPQFLAVDPSGKYAYVANSGSNNVSQYTIAANGALAPTSTIAAGTNPVALTVDPSGAFVYVANLGSADVSQYAIGLNGNLTLMATPVVAAGTSPRSVTSIGRYQ